MEPTSSSFFKKPLFWAILLGLVLVAVWLLSFSAKPAGQPAAPSQELTLEQRAKILESLQPPAGAPAGTALTERQRQDLLESLTPPPVKGAQPQRQLTPEERAKLLQSLQTP